MPRRVRTHLPGDAATDSPLAPKHLTKQQFGKRLYNLMVAKGWHQSELARRAGLPCDSISVYVRGKSIPTPTNLKQLADTLGVAPEELLPNVAESAIDEDHPAFEMRQSPNAPHTAWLRVNRLVTMSTAIKIAALLEDDDADVNGGGSSKPAAVQSKQG